MATPPELMALRHKYYTSFPFMRNITVLLSQRYLAYHRKLNEDDKDGVMNRYNRAYHSKEWMKVYTVNHFDQIDSLQLYYCLATLHNSFPVLPWFGTERQKMKKQIEKDFEKYILGFDWAIELDAGKNAMTGQEKDLMAVWRDTLEICQILDSYPVIYYVKFSGRRGFHIRIPAEYTKPFSIKDIHRSCVKFMTFYADLNIDTFSNDHMKLWKLDYSVVDDNVALPLTEGQLNNFNMNMVKLTNVMKKIPLVDERGVPRLLPMRNINKQNALEGTHKFIREWMSIK